MTSPGVENTLADPHRGHERQESKDSQATLTDDVANRTPTNDRRSRKRASGDGDDDGAHDAKRFRVTAETPAGPTADVNAGYTTESPTAAAPESISIFTTAAPAVVDHHDATLEEPDEVPFAADEPDAASHVECGGGGGADESSFSDEWIEDEEHWPPGCQWNIIGPARLGDARYADWVDRFGVAWRLDVTPGPRLDAVHYPGFPTWEWTSLGHVSLGYGLDANYVDAFGNAWRLTLFRPARAEGDWAPRFAAAAGRPNEPSMGADEAPSDYDATCCCCRGCCSCPLAAADSAQPYPYQFIRLGESDLPFDDAHYVDRYGVYWRRELMPSPWSDIDEASSSSDEVSSEEDEVSSLDDGAQENVPVNDKRSDADVEDNTDDEVFEDAGATDAEDDGSDVGVDYEEDEFFPRTTCSLLAVYICWLVFLFNPFVPCDDWCELQARWAR